MTINSVFSMMNHIIPPPLLPLQIVSQFLSMRGGGDDDTVIVFVFFMPQNDFKTFLQII
jgi:hypothetical protein